MSQGPLIPVPDDLREKIQAALGRDVPKEIDLSEAKALARELASKAPALSRPFADLVVQVNQAVARSKPSPKALKPKFPLSLLYTTDESGNWVPSRLRITVAGMLGALLFTFAILYPIISSSPRQPPSPSPAAASQAPSPPASPNPAPEPQPETPPLPLPPSAQQGGAQGDAAGGSAGAVGGQSEGGMQMPSQSPLPSPPPDIPPPPDYQPPQDIPTAESETVIWRRQVPAGSPQEGQGGQNTITVWSRVRSEGLEAQRVNPGQSGGEGGSEQEGDQESAAPSGYWRRGGNDGWEPRGLGERKVDELLTLSPRKGGGAERTEEAPQDAAGYWRREREQEDREQGLPKGQGAGEEGAAEVVIWRRSQQDNAAGGIVPPASVGERTARTRQGGEADSSTQQLPPPRPAPASSPGSEGQGGGTP